MEQMKTDRKVAEELALEVRAASGGPRTWRRVASLLEAFGVDRLSDDVRERIAAALADVQIQIDPPLDALDRDEMVRLALPDTELIWTEATGGARPPREVIDATEWDRRAAFTELALDAPRTGGLTAWFDVDPSRATPDRILDELWPYCRSELTREMSEDLLDAGGRPGVRGYGSDGHVRLVTVLGIEARDDPAGRPGSKAGQLVFRPVKLLAGSDWLVSCWHEDPARADFAAAVTTVQRRLARLEEPPTPGDLGINVVYSLTSTYPATERHLHAWLVAWELDFNQHVAGGGLASLERATLMDLRGLLADLRTKLHGFEQPGLDPSEAWFSGLRDGETPARVRGAVTATLTDLQSLDDALRTSLDLLVTTSVAEQLAASQEQAAQAERLNRQLALVASALLVPSFLAELFGTKLFPGGDGDWWSFGLLLVAMVALGLATYRYLSRRQA